MKGTVKIVSFLSLLLVSLTSLAEDIDTQNNLRNKLLEISSYSANFVQVVSNEIGDELQRTTGLLSFGKPNRMRWQVLTPDESLSVIDGKHIYNIDPFVEQVTIINQENIIADNPLALLLNDDEKVWETVDVKRDGNTYTVTSKSPDANITDLLLYFDNEENLVRIQTKDLQGQMNNLEFSDIEMNPMLAANHFVAEIPDGYAIDDQR